MVEEKRTNWSISRASDQRQAAGSERCQTIHNEADQRRSYPGWRSPHINPVTPPTLPSSTSADHWLTITEKYVCVDLRSDITEMCLSTDRTCRHPLLSCVQTQTASKHNSYYLLQNYEACTCLVTVLFASLVISTVSNNHWIPVEYRLTVTPAWCWGQRSPAFLHTNVGQNAGWGTIVEV